MDKTFFLWLLSILGILYVIVGYRASKKVKNINDYFLAGRKLGLFALTIALIATQLGGGVILGTSSESYHVGLYGMIYVVSISLGFIILAAGLAGRLRSFNVATTAELFELKYHSPFLRHVASLLSSLSLCGLLAAQIVASRNLLLSLDVYSETVFILFWLFVIGYTMVGGLRAVVENDIFQLAFIILVFVGLFAYELISNPGSVIQIIFRNASLFAAPQALTVGRFLAIFIIPACYCLIEQDVAQTLFAARTPRIALTGAFLAGVFMLSFAIIPAYFGMKAHALNLVVPPGANPLIYLFDASHTPIVVALVVYGVFAAIISTADALLCAISSHLVQDFKLTEHTRHALTISKMVTLAIGLITLIAGRYFNNIIDVIVGSYSIPVSALFASLIIAYFTHKPSRTGAFISVFSGLISFTLFKLFSLPVFGSPESAALALSFMGYAIGYFYDQIKNTQLKNT